MNIAILGCQWGDEGKGKIIDFLASYVTAVVRFQGCHNASHIIVVNNQKIKLHLVPSAILHKQVKCIIAHGVLIHLPALFHEIRMLENLEIELKDHLYISLLSPILLKSHILLDKSQETMKGNIGTHKVFSGIGPATADKIAKRGLRMYDLFDEVMLEEKLRYLLDYHNFILKNYYQIERIDLQHEFDELLNYRAKISSMITDTNQLIFNLDRDNKNILFEGSQGTMLDINFGTYPFVTSANTILGSVMIGSGFARIERVIGVIKAYTTKGNGGPFPTEITGNLGNYLALKGAEFSNTTNHQRRCGWLDLVSLRYAIKLNKITEIVITKLDVLDELDEIKVCTNYKYVEEILNTWPIKPEILSKVTPIYKEFKGWCSSTYGISDYNRLPDQTKKYIKFISRFLDVKISLISTGIERTATIVTGNF